MESAIRSLRIAEKEQSLKSSKYLLHNDERRGKGNNDSESAHNDGIAERRKKRANDKVSGAMRATHNCEKEGSDTIAQLCVHGDKKRREGANDEIYEGRVFFNPRLLLHVYAIDSELQHASTAHVSVGSSPIVIVTTIDEITFATST